MFNGTIFANPPSVSTVSSFVASSRDRWFRDFLTETSLERSVLVSVSDSALSSDTNWLRSRFILFHRKILLICSTFVANNASNVCCAQFVHLNSSEYCFAAFGGRPPTVLSETFALFSFSLCKTLFLAKGLLDSVELFDALSLSLIASLTQVCQKELSTSFMRSITICLFLSSKAYNQVITTMM